MLKPLTGLFSNHVLLCALLAWLVAQLLKIPLYRLVEKKWDIRRFFGSGGMPSSHTALVIALTLMAGATEGFDTAQFAICVALSAIVMVDAAGVRRETGTQAQIINELLRRMILEGQKISDEELKELVGHTPLEVMGGAVVGLVVSVLYLLLIIPK